MKNETMKCTHTLRLLPKPFSICHSKENSSKSSKYSLDSCETKYITFRLPSCIQQRRSWQARRSSPAEHFPDYARKPRRFQCWTTPHPGQH